MKRTILFRPERCLLCQGCVLACQLNALDLADPREFTRGGNPPRRLSLALVDQRPRASLCRHCAQPPCAEACISGSIVRDNESGRLVHHPETCVGCGSCELVCPAGAISRSEGSDGVTKCNLCPDETVPPCVGACATGALVVGREDLGAERKRRRLAMAMAGGCGHG